MLQIIGCLTALLPEDLWPAHRSHRGSNWLSFSQAGLSASSFSLQVGSLLWGSGFKKSSAALRPVYFLVPEGDATKVPSTPLSPLTPVGQSVRHTPILIFALNKCMNLLCHLLPIIPSGVHKCSVRVRRRHTADHECLCYITHTSGDRSFHCGACPPYLCM